MKRPSTVLFATAIALACIVTISFTNTSEGFLPETSGAVMLQVVFTITGFAMAALGLIARRAEHAIYSSRQDIAVKLNIPV